jgi:ATP-dependent Clp protease ATP-binding subunit ClpA
MPDPGPLGAPRPRRGPRPGDPPLKRILQQRIANPLANALLEERVKAGSTVNIGWDGHDFTFTSAPVEAATA